MKFDAELCCGCGACANVCPTDAISWIKNDEGFSEPLIDQSACVDCGLCRKVCPYETNHVGVDASPAVFAAVNRDTSVVLQSSSGGVFSVLSDYVLDQGGVVYGVGFDDAFRLRYVRAEDRTMRDAFRESKYVQCDGKDVFFLVVSDLKAGHLVMFTGTPCQVSGLKLFLQVKKVPTERLLTVDNVCHGAASPKVWEAYIEYIQTEVLHGSKIEHLSLRSKKVAWQRQDIDCETDAGDESDLLNNGVSWNKLYLTTYATRRSCFKCRFASYDRVGDITLADYWNIENAGLRIDYKDGVNLVLVNSQSGSDWLNACVEKLTLEPSDKKSCWQIHLERPLPANGNRMRFWSEFSEDAYRAIRTYSKGSRFNAITRRVTPVLRKLGLYTFAVRVFSTIKKAK